MSDHQIFSNTIEKNGYKYYVVPKGYPLFKALKTFRNANDISLTLKPNKPYFFGLKDTDPDYIADYEQEYGVIFEYITLEPIELLALDDMKTMNKLYKESTVQIQMILDKNYKKSRLSESEPDRIFSDYLCQVKNPDLGNGYAIYEMETDFGGTFHPELLICNASKYVKYVKQVTTSTKRVEEIIEMGKLKRMTDDLEQSRKEARKKYHKPIHTNTINTNDDFDFKPSKNLFGDDDDEFSGGRKRTPTKKTKKNLRKRTTNKCKKNLRKRKSKKNLRKTKYGGELDKNVINIVQSNIQQRANNLGKMLNASCANSDNCLALGIYNEYIKRYFEDFRNLSYVDNANIKKIGNPSSNGFILELPFEKKDLAGNRVYKADTILKCASSPSADNLFYEFFVGKFFINTYLKKYTCFVETYDCYLIDNRKAWETMYNYTNTSANPPLDIQNMIVRKDIKDSVSDNMSNFARSCLENRRLCILLQHFDKFTSFHDEYKNNYDNIKYDVLNVLYQAYYCLAALSDVYTHYDLHWDNVFLYKPYDGKQYIIMKYHRNGKVYEFKTEYIVKIIDYGRNYFSNKTENTSDILENYVCPALQCQPQCGLNVGYAIIQGTVRDLNTKFYDILPNKPNISHDLRFASKLSRFLKDINLFESFTYDNEYGTPEKKDGSAKIIKNVINMRDCLEKHISGWNKGKLSKKYDSAWSAAASIEIFDDGRDYIFTILPSPNP